MHDRIAVSRQQPEGGLVATLGYQEFFPFELESGRLS